MHTRSFCTSVVHKLVSTKSIRFQYPHETYAQFKDQYLMPMTFDIYSYLAALALLQPSCV